MIKPKKGICIDCPENGIEKPLTAKRCFHHYWIHRAEVNAKKNAWKEPKRKEMKSFLDSAKQKKPIPKQSAKRKIENKEYTIKRLQFLAQPENQRCFIDGCNAKADTIEHRAGRTGSNYLDISTWAACCNYHNLELERNPELSQKYQLSKITGKQKLVKT